ncbi:hypothetical protein B0J14DRAFT_606425 [Halenospora varia]|nr:hypothetical protein B0J14DRAFT_606425 [Halenospora varia]
MADKQPIQAEAIPQTLSHLIALNKRYGLLLCLNEKCRYAVCPAAMSDHLCRQHQYIKGFPHQYNYSTVNLLVDGLECDHCPVQSSGPFRTQSRKALKQYRNKIHNKKRVLDEDLFHPECQPGQSCANRASQADEGHDDDGDDDSNHNDGGSGDGNQEVINDQIVQEIENKVLSQSKHNMIKTYRFTRKADPDKPELARVCRDMLKWWKSPKNEVADQHPFKLPQNANIITKYNGI